MLRYRRVKAKRITEEFIDAMKFYSYIEYFDLHKLKFYLKKFGLMGMTIRKFRKVHFEAFHHAGIFDMADLMALQDIIHECGTSFIITTPKISIVEFAKTKIRFKNQLVDTMEVDITGWNPIRIKMYYNSEEQLVSMCEERGKLQYQYYFNKDNYFLFCNAADIIKIIIEDTEKCEREEVFGMGRSIKRDKNCSTIKTYVYNAPNSKNGDYGHEKYYVHPVYDEKENLVSTTYTENNINYLITYTYDESNRCTEIVEFQNGIVMSKISLEYKIKRNRITKIIKHYASYNNLTRTAGYPILSI